MGWGHPLPHTINVKGTKPYPEGTQIKLIDHICDFFTGWVRSLPLIVEIGCMYGPKH